jgi:hypothetical protein
MVEESGLGRRFCCGMRALPAVLALALLIPAAAPADTVGTATTSSGQTLRISIETPYDGVTVYGTTDAAMQGHATIDGQGSDAITAIKVGMGDAYEAPGSTDYGNANGGYSTFDGQWGSYNQMSFTGTQKLYATAIAADGTRATANLTITLDPKNVYRLAAYGALYDENRGGPTGALQASMSFDRTPYETVGRSIDFFVNGEKVCTASIAYTGDLVDPWFLARCQDPVAVAKATAAGGYEARWEGDQNSYPASASAGLVVRN